MQEQFRESCVPVIAVGFSPAAALKTLADTLGWEGPFISDEHRELYQRLGLARAGLLRTYSVGTLLRYARAAAGGRRLPRAVEDTRQLGGDAVIVDGSVRVLWQPRTPDDRVEPALVRATVDRLTEAR